MAKGAKASSLEADGDVIFSFIATAEPGDEESVTRAKYFIRDEFLVSIAFLVVCVLFLGAQIQIRIIIKNWIIG